MVETKQLASLILTIVVVGLVLNQFFAVTIAASEDVDISEDVLITGGSGELSWDGGVENFTIKQSLGDSVELTGAEDSKLEGDATVEHDETWTVSLWANASQNRTQRAVQFGGWFMVDLVNVSDTTTEWRVTYYDEHDMTVHQVNVSAPNATTWTNLVVTANGSDGELVVYRNNTQVGSTDLSTESGSVPQDVSNWDGRLEETRAYDDVVGSSQRSTLYDTPTAPVKANETARIYYDARAGESSIDVYRTGGDLTLSNASVVDGFAGQDLEQAGVLGNGDWRRDGRTVIAVDGGKLDGAPVAFVDYDGTGGQIFNLAAFARAVSSSISLVSLAAIIGAASILLGLWDDF